MALKKRGGGGGVIFKICFRKRGYPERGGVPTLEETMLVDAFASLIKFNDGHLPTFSS